MRPLVSSIARLRDSDLPVLVTGETGSGKETVARHLHRESARGERPFLAVDCATLSERLLETELFGARSGAYTGLDEDRAGLLAAAEGGTILLDEIGEASLAVQSKLLRVLAQGTYRRLGEEEETLFDGRFVFSSSRDLEGEVAAGRFRRDLFHRLQVVTLRVPPLRERPEDLGDLIALFWRQETGLPPILDDDALQRLRALPWPGNVRELRNLVQRLRLEDPRRVGRDTLDRVLYDPRTASVFPRNLLAAKELPELKRQLERDYVMYHLRRLDHDSSELSRFLGVSRQQLYRRCWRLGIRLREEKQRPGGGGDPRSANDPERTAGADVDEHPGPSRP